LTPLLPLLTPSFPFFSEDQGLIYQPRTSYKKRYPLLF
jgi:hypothetical protein